MDASCFSGDQLDGLFALSQSFMHQLRTSIQPQPPRPDPVAQPLQQPSLHVGSTTSSPNPSPPLPSAFGQPNEGPKMDDNIELLWNAYEAEAEAEMNIFERSLEEEEEKEEKEEENAEQWPSLSSLIPTPSAQLPGGPANEKVVLQAVADGATEEGSSSHKRHCQASVAFEPPPLPFQEVSLERCPLLPRKKAPIVGINKDTLAILVPRQQEATDIQEHVLLRVWHQDPSATCSSATACEKDNEKGEGSIELVVHRQSQHEHTIILPTALWKNRAGVATITFTNESKTHSAHIKLQTTATSTNRPTRFFRKGKFVTLSSPVGPTNQDNESQYCTLKIWPTTNGEQ